LEKTHEIAIPLFCAFPRARVLAGQVWLQRIGNVVAEDIYMTTNEREKHSPQGICGCHYHHMSPWFTLQIVLREMRRSRRMADHLR